MPPDPSLDLEDQLCFALYSASNALTRAYRPLLAEFGLTYPQYLVMLVLWQHGPQNASNIARHLRLAPNAITPIVDHLVDAGFVARRQVAGDRRRVRIVLTDHGAAQKSRAARAQAEVACRTGLSEAELRAFLTRLNALQQHMDAAPTRQTAETCMSATSS